MSTWETKSTDLIHTSLSERLLAGEYGRNQEYKKYADYYDGRPGVMLPYFLKRHRETAERFADRPKLSWPICRIIADTHAEALANEIKITLDDPDTQLWWDALSEHNQVGAFLKLCSQIVSVYGSVGVKPLLYDDGTREKVIEFEAYPPDVVKFVYDRNSQGRSVKRYHGAAIMTSFSVENATVLPFPVDAITGVGTKSTARIEYISKDQWIVMFGGKQTAVSPTGEIWMPAEDGSNPYKEIMVALLNGLETHEDFLGISDLHQSIYDVQTVNEIFSDLVYMHRMYVPIAVIKSDNPDSRAAFKAGIGAGVAINKDEDFTYANASVDFAAAQEPLKIALEIMYSNSKVPAAAAGLGHLFGQQSTVSGVAKEYEYKPTISHANAKWPAFKRGIIQLVRMALKIGAMSPPYGQGARIKPDAQITVERNESIVPTSKAEEMERITKEIAMGVQSTFQSMIDYHGWDQTRAAREMDLIAAEHKRHLVEDLGFKHIVDLVTERQALEITTKQKEAADEVLFGATPPMQGDVTSEPGDDMAMMGEGE